MNAPTQSLVGHWICRHTTDAADTDVAPLLPHDGAIAAGAVLNRRLALPEGARRDEELTDSERDRLTDVQLQTVTPYPDPRFAVQFRHFILNDPATHKEVGEMWLRVRAEEAERLDYEFALRMQGLQNSGINAVWVCSEMGAEPGDRPNMMEQFLRAYLSRFLSQAPMSAQENPDVIIREAVQMHQQVIPSPFFSPRTRPPAGKKSDAFTWSARTAAPTCDAFTWRARTAAPT
jgi:hypothetical protein